MEILALLGMPKAQSVPGRNNSLQMFQVTADTGADTTLTNIPGAPVDVIKATNSAGWSDISWRLQFLSGFGTLGPVAYDRMVFGWRLVTTKAPPSDNLNMQCPRLNFLAAPVGSTSYSQAATPVSLTPFVVSPEGQYFEAVVDLRTSDVELYLDGMFLTRHRIFSVAAAINREMTFMVDGYIDNWRQSLGSIEYRAHIRDLYIARLGNNEVFEPLGGIDVTNLPTASLSYTGGSTPANLDAWTFSWTYTLDTAGVAEHTQTMTDPTPLKDAIAITAIAGNIVGATAYMEARSGGVKIADETKFTYRPASYNSRIVRIDPSKIGSDLVMAFRVDP